MTADSGAVAARTLAVTMTFHVTSTEPVILALPAWSPGHYTILWFAGRVSRFRAESDGRPLEWRKLDFQTWSIRPRAAGTVRVAFDYAADAVDRAIAWTSPNFAFFNGTNLFLYPVGHGFDWPARVAVRTEPGWRVTTGMDPALAPNAFSATNYHDLVDMPFYVGRFDLDSARAADRWIRFALYPAGAMTPARRDRTLGWFQKLVPAHAAVFGEVPFRNYTVFVRSDTLVNFGGLEHQSSQVDEVFSSLLVSVLDRDPEGGNDLNALFSHELFHAWNVKRLRPADLVPYRYDAAQPTAWLWVSEGVTDYYGTLALSRTGIVDSAAAFGQVANWIANVDAAPPTAVSDASLSAWIGSRDGSGGLYYPKGALTGFLLDVLIRHASNNRRSLDDVMRQLYDSTYKRGRGFTSDDWWSAVARNAGTRGAKATFLAFAHRYVDGREPLPVDSVLSLAALRTDRTTIREPRFGVTTRTDSSGVEVASIVPGGAASLAGVRVGDRLVAVGDVKITDLPSFADVRARYAGTTLATLPAVIRRGAETVTLQVQVRFVERTELRVVPVPAASPRAIAIRHAIFLGASREPTPQISGTDRIRIREAYRLAARLGDRVWPGWHDAPFALLLVTPDYEFLVHHPNPTPDFTSAGPDTLLGGRVFYRKRVFPTAIQATFPAVNGVNTIVVGQAERTADKTSTRWVLTVLHEHFHQLAYSRRGYYADVEKLGLAHGDNTGMWMLNYPFPYDSTLVQEKFTAMTRALRDALAPADGPRLDEKASAFARAQREFRESVPAEASTYFEFQLWQEGVARYTEVMLGELAARDYTPSPEFASLPDFASYGAVVAAVRRRILDDLASLSLGKSRREVVYSVGAGEALLLDRLHPEWKQDYLTHPFRLRDPR